MDEFSLVYNNTGAMSSLMLTIIWDLAVDAALLQGSLSAHLPVQLSQQVGRHQVLDPGQLDVTRQGRLDDGHFLFEVGCHTTFVFQAVLWRDRIYWLVD